MPPQREQIIAVLKTAGPFKKLSDEQLGRVVDAMGAPVEVAANEVIYQQGERGGYFYCIYEGRVRLSRYESERELSVALYGKGDLFGHEVLGVSEYRHAKATALESGVLLRFSLDVLTALALDILPLNQALGQERSSFALFLQTPLDWLNPDETVYYITRKHTIFLQVALAMPVAVTLFSVLVGLLFLSMGMQGSALLVTVVPIVIAVLWGIWLYIDWANDYYVITNQRVLYQERVALLYDSRQEIPLDAVLSTTLQTSQWGRWFGYGNVIVKSYTGTIRMPRIGMPDFFIQMLDTMRGRANVLRAREERLVLQNALRKKLGLSPMSMSSSSPAAQPATKKAAAKAAGPLASLFAMRMEKAGTIIYRTHVVLMLKKTLLPSLAILAIFSIPVLRLMGYFAFLSVGAVIALAFVLFLFAFVWWFYYYLDWRNDLYIIASDQLMDLYKKPLGKEVKLSSPIKNIISIEYSRPTIINQLFNYGTVFIKVGEATFTFNNVPNPSEVQREIFNRFIEVTYREKQNTMLAERQLITDMLELYHSVVEQERKASSSSPPAAN